LVVVVAAGSSVVAGAAVLVPLAGAGAGASVFAGSPDFCSSALLHPTTARLNVSRENKERMIAITFFTARHLLSKLLHV